MKKFITNLKTYAEENPIVALAVGAAAVTAVAKLIEASAHNAGSRAYAKDVNRRINKSK